MRHQVCLRHQDCKLNMEVTLAKSSIRTSKCAEPAGSSFAVHVQESVAWTASVASTSSTKLGFDHAPESFSVEL